MHFKLIHAIITHFILGIVVASTESTPDCRVYDKRYYCPFCESTFSKLPRHLESEHSEEPAIVELSGETERAKRKVLLLKLRNLGNHIHNLKVLKQGVGTLQVVYRSKTVPFSSYVACSHCLGYYAPGDLWKHVQNCPLNKMKEVKGRRHVAAGRLIMSATEHSQALHKVLASLKNDAVSRAIRQDCLILKLGEQLCLKHGHEPEQHGYIRNSLRELGRLLIQLRLQQPLRNLSLIDVVTPVHFDAVLQASKAVSGFNKDTNTMKTPSLALRLGAVLGKVANIMHGEGLVEDNAIKAKSSEDFLKLLSLRWNVEMSTSAHRTLNEAKKNKVKLLPLSADLKKMSDHLKEEITTQMSTLNESVSWATYHNLQKAVLSLIILFNRKRSGEVSRMKLSELESASKHDHEDLGLSDFEKALAQSLKRLEIRGKRGRNVAVLLTELMNDALGALTRSRQKVGIPSTNRHVFATLSDDGYVRGSEVIKSFSESCGASNPSAIRATNLRKHIATMTQLLNLRKNELDVVANFMGHDIAVHRQFYRLPEETTQLAKVSKLLMAMEKGAIGSLRGKNLDDITTDDYAEAGVRSVLLLFGNSRSTEFIVLD